MSEATFLCLDQRQRWHRGDRVLVEAYLENQPALQGDADAVLDLIYNEIVLRETAGDKPQLDEYLKRFPKFGAELLRQFEVHNAIQENASPASSMAESRAGTPTVADEAEEAAPPHVRGYQILREIGR